MPPIPPPKNKNPDPGSLGPVQPVFDTVTGPNLRLRDNLLQLAATFASVILGILIALLVMTDKMAALFVGGFIGLTAGILLSGTLLGIYRFFTTVKRK